MEHFYVETLGLPVRSRRPGFVNFAWGEQRLTVTLHSDVSGAAAEPARLLVNLACDDVDGEAARLAAAGVAVLRPPETESWGGRICTVVDPDGNLLQLLGQAPG